MSHFVGCVLRCVTLLFPILVAFGVPLQSEAPLVTNSTLLIIIIIRRMNPFCLQVLHPSWTTHCQGRGWSKLLLLCCIR
mgnify:CR=1 FL=1